MKASDWGPIVGIIGTVLILGLLLKDAANFNTLMNGLNTTLTTLENAGGSGGGLQLPNLSVGG